MLVRLERIKKAVAPAKGTKPAVKLPRRRRRSRRSAGEVAAARWRSPADADAQPPKKKKVVDPYERVDENPPQEVAATC